jgi:hypothetical protein
VIAGGAHEPDLVVELVAVVERALLDVLRPRDLVDEAHLARRHTHALQAGQRHLDELPFHLADEGGVLAT